MSQNSEQLARYAGKCDFCDYGGVFAPACAALSRATGFVKRCTDVALIRRLRRNQGNRSSRTSPPEVLILFGPQMQKSLLVEQAFRIWSVIEDDLPLRGSPYGPLLTQRSLATLESNLPPEVLILFGPQMQKSLLIEQAFRIWSVIEDSNLRPLRPERSALPGCANHRMRGASYCWDAPPSMPY